jgi:hypothetical protein
MMASEQRTWGAAVPDHIAGDRRDAVRYPLSLELKYKLIRRRKLIDSGVGHTVDLSSGGVLFETDRPLPVGLNVELSVAWPVLLHGVAPMRLFVTGRIVRTSRNRTAIRTVQHEFRTQGISTVNLSSQDNPVIVSRPPAPPIPTRQSVAAY